MNPRNTSSDQDLDFAVETLLRSAENDGPSPTSLGKTAAVLGVSVAPFVTTSTASAAGAGGAAANVVGAAGTATSSIVAAGASQTGVFGLGVGLGKIAAIGVLVTGTAGVTLSQTWDRADTPAVSVSSSPRAAEKVTPAAPVDPPPRSSTTPLESAPPPRSSPRVDRQVVTPRRPSVVVPAAPDSEQKENSLERELGMLSEARASLRRGDGSGCLSAVDEYERTFPSGTLSVEAAVLRIEALLITAGKEAARKEAEAFQRRMPKSMHLERFILLGLLDDNSGAQNEATRNQ